MKLLELIVAAGGRVAGGEPFGWNSFGPDAWFLDFTDTDGNMFCHGIYDTRTFCVYRVELEQPNGFTAMAINQYHRWLPIIRYRYASKKINK